jgi:hypothetical protein
MYCDFSSRSSAVGTYSMSTAPSRGVTPVIAWLIVGWDTPASLRQFFQNAIPAHVCQGYDHGFVQAWNRRPRPLAGQRLRVDHCAQVENAVAENPVGRIHVGARYLVGFECGNPILPVGGPPFHFDTPDRFQSTRPE